MPCVSTQNVYVNISRIVAVGKRLLEGGHYAAVQIQQLSAQLEREWKAFASALDERSAMLEMSASFHQKADQVRHTRIDAITSGRDFQRMISMRLTNTKAGKT